jgi:Ca2+-binding EF-hand superfamily protein
MSTSRLIPALALLLAAPWAQGQTAPGDIARGNMHFDAKAMDMNGDGMISKEEMQKYGESMWQKMAANEKRMLPVADAATDFARGNMRFDAKKMDANGDGMITSDEFMKYAMAQFESTKKDANGMISVNNAALAFGRGNMPPK